MVISSAYVPRPAKLSRPRITPPAMAPMVISSRTVTLTVQQLLSLHTVETKIGRLTCKQWNDHLMDYFMHARNTPGNHDFNRLFSALKDIFIPNRSRERISGERRSMAMQFRAKFASFLARKSILTGPEAIEAADVFVTLKEFAFKIQDPKDRKLPIKPHVVELNRRIRMISTRDELLVEVK